MYYSADAGARARLLLVVLVLLLRLVLTGTRGAPGSMYACLSVRLV